MKRMINRVDIIVVKMFAAMVASEWLYRETYSWDELGPLLIVGGFILSVVVDVVGWLRANFTRRKKED